MSRSTVDKRPLPDFLGIGLPRAGTTWLYDVLRKHPAVWMPWKEIHYFDSIDPSAESGFHMTSRRFRIAKFGTDLLSKSLVAVTPFGEALASRISRGRPAHPPGVSWLIRFACGQVNDEWYGSLFRDGADRGLVTGEITPAYCMLSDGVVQKIRAMAPSLRVVLILRNPIERAWSTACFGLSDDTLRGMTETELLGRCPKPGLNTRFDDARVVRRWRAALGSEQLLVLFFDDLKQNPQTVFDAVCEHLGVAQVALAEIGANEAAIGSSTGGRQVTRAGRRYLAELYLDELDQLRQMAGGWAARWYEDALSACM